MNKVCKLDLSITKYFDSLKEIHQKEILGLRAKASGNFEGSARDQIQRKLRGRPKITMSRKTKGRQPNPEQTLLSNETAYGMNQESNLDGFQSS